MLATEARYRKAKVKRLYYLSIEYLIGRSLSNNIINLGLMDEVRQILDDMGLNLDQVLSEENDAGLGNGGLGRLAVCFLDSLATLDMPAIGYGINYEYGLFKQEITNGYQKEKPDNWMANGTPWEIVRPEEVCYIPLYGKIDHAQDRNGGYNPMWLDWKLLVGVPHDIPISGYGGRTVNILRLFTARASNEFDIRIFNEGDYIRAVKQKIETESISKVLYPSDAVISGRELRLVQEYFMVACAVRDIVRRYCKDHDTFDAFPEEVAIHLNDTHPALTVPELMRVFVDEHELPWEFAWELTRSTLGYTNHTLMPEALEKWPVSLMEYVLPRHLQIIYEINQRFLQQASAKWRFDSARIRNVSIVEEGEQKLIRMANIAMVGCHSVNGVSALHSDLITKKMAPDFFALWPEIFNNKTNGVTPRRWLKLANPHFSKIITEAIGEEWVTDLTQLRKLEKYADDAGFQEDFLQAKRVNKERLARIIRDTTCVIVDTDSLFDVQVKRIHEYKRQLLNLLRIIHEYLRIVQDNIEPSHPRTCIFAGKAAPGYATAKNIIKLINNVAQVVNNDPKCKSLLKVVFLPDYRVSLAERIIPAADLSEQISTAGMEASGTGNMKFTINGALTIGTLDGANIEILQEVGEENIYIFGLTASEIEEMRLAKSYDPMATLNEHPDLKRVVDTLSSELFSPGEPGLFNWVRNNLTEYGDYYMHLADMPSYLKAQDHAGAEYRNKPLWSRKAILNVARSGKFSSDRTIREYAEEIWGIKPCPAENIMALD
jgi:starch phosphorylase